MNFNLSTCVRLILFVAFSLQCSIAADEPFGLKEIFDGCNFQGKESVNTDNVNCTKLPIPALWNEDANKRCIYEFVKGCKAAKIQQFCHQGANDHLKNKNLKCESPKQDYEYGMDFYVLCCNVCSAGKQAYLNKQPCQKELPLNAELSQVIVEAEFANCCSNSATKGLRSMSDLEYDYFEEICDRYGCEHFCQEIDYDKAECSCRTGYRLNKDGRKCDDIDECSDVSLNICGPNQKCTNMNGSYECENISIPETEVNRILRSNLNDSIEDVSKCKKNEYFDPHRNKCIETVNDYENICLDEKCDTSVDKLVTLAKECEDGNQLNKEHNLCEDLNECQIENICPKDQICINMIKNFTCLNANETIICDSGLFLNGTSCDDVNECLIKGTCREDQSCINLLGNYECVDLQMAASTIINNSSLQSRNTDAVNNTSNQTLSDDKVASGEGRCEDGQELDSQGDCIDIDPCIKNRDICGKNGICHAEFGKAKCECEDGFEMKKIVDNEQNKIIEQCEDINECESSNDCLEETSICRNLNGSYECDCKNGFERSGSDKGCYDIDECKQDDKKCQHICLNTPGSYICKCHNDNYELQSDNKTCVERNMCNTEHFCDGICERKPGESSDESEYVCKKCDKGFKLDEKNAKCISEDFCGKGYCENDHECVHLKNGKTICLNLKCSEDYEEDNVNKICMKKFNLDDSRPLTQSKKVLILPLIYLKGNQSRTIFRFNQPESDKDVEFKMEIDKSGSEKETVDESYFKIIDQNTSHHLIVIRPILSVQSFIIELNAIYKKRKLHTSILYVFVV